MEARQRLLTLRADVERAEKRLQKEKNTMEVKERMRTEAELERLNRMMEKFDKKKAGLSSDYRYIAIVLLLLKINGTFKWYRKSALFRHFLAVFSLYRELCDLHKVDCASIRTLQVLF